MSPSLLRRTAIGFAAGFIGVLLFHQGFLLLAYLVGWVSRPPYDFAPTAPLGVPKVLSLAFWGGLWGIVLMAALAPLPPRHRLLAALLFGGILPTLAGTLVVAPLKGSAISLQPLRLLFGFVINGIWGLGSFLTARVIGARRPA